MTNNHPIEIEPSRSLFALLEDMAKAEGLPFADACFDLILHEGF